MLKNKEIWKMEKEEEEEEEGEEEEEEDQGVLKANKDKRETKLLNKLLIFLAC